MLFRSNPPTQISSKPTGNKYNAPLGINEALITQHKIPWDSCLSKLDNLRKVSISPWCDEEFMGEMLAGSKVIYHRKPSPNYLGVGTSLDEDGLRASLRKTFQAARGCKLEITQRDVYTINGDIGKAKRYVDIVKEEIEMNWKG